MSRTVLVTGCAGFIGSHVVERLLRENVKVIGIDNFDPFYPRAIKEQNLGIFRDHADFQFVEGDICAASTFAQIETPPDLVIHLAAKAGVLASINDPQGYLQTNLQGSQNILDWMRSQGCKKMLFASSSSVYGNNKKVPFAESDVIDNPISPYAFTKKACELQNHVYHHLYGMDIINLRFFTVYGERQRPDLAIHKFTQRILQGQPIQMYGDGSTSRDYTYVQDTVEGIFKAMARLWDAAEPIFETYNLGNSRPISLKELIASIEKHVGQSAVIEQQPSQPGDVERTYADISQAQAGLGYAPQISLDEGIARFVDWKRKDLQA